MVALTPYRFGGSQRLPTTAHAFDVLENQLLVDFGVFAAHGRQFEITPLHSAPHADEMIYFVTCWMYNATIAMSICAAVQ